ncbi:MAG: RNA polymerase sigma factor [Lewinellaceae bacterium]|nr:RNA polymerase sigma factor [Phaeodactylibacter sp.]MCB9040109.1 RNA polymerase sigma factor [Lewinellaceae bacterium]
MDFDTIYKEFSHKIFRLCLGYLNDTDKAYDLTQETFIAVWLNLHSFKHKSGIGTWIYRIACNKCLRQIEKDARIKKVELPFQVEQKIDISNIQEQKHIFLRNCIADLPELERIIIGLFMEDVPQEKIAEIVGLSHSNVRVKIHRIKKKLTQKFIDNGQF